MSAGDELEMSWPWQLPRLGIRMRGGATELKSDVGA